MVTECDPLDAACVLGVAAHPDDLDVTAGGTIARLAANGADVHFLILTDGSKGSDNLDMSSKHLVSVRQSEQRAAAKALGVSSVTFLNYEDGGLECTKTLKADIVKHIRTLKPDTVITMDPTVAYVADKGYINHPDHRACGQATLDSIFPLARDHLSFPEQLVDGVTPHKVSTVLLANWERHNCAIDISGFLDIKCQAIEAHASQFSDVETVCEHFRSSAIADGRRYGVDSAELFVRIDVR